MSTAVAISSVLRRDLTRTLNRRHDAVKPLVFFVLVVVVFAITLGQNPAALASLGPSVIWVAVLLAITLSVDSLFVDDYHSGALDLMLLSTGSATAVAAAKLAGFWVVAALPQIVAALAAGMVLGYAGSVLLVLGVSLSIGSIVLCGTGGIASALTVGLRSGGVLVAIITLPLSIPTLIFGSGAVQHAVAGRDASAELYFLAGLAVLSVTLTPFATAAALRVRMT